MFTHQKLPNRILKECASQITPGLTAIFKKFIYTGNFSQDLLNANISCVFKKSDKHAAENYRPVSLTSGPSTIYSEC